MAIKNNNLPMFKLLFSLLGALLLFAGCGSMFDITGRGSKDRKIYYDVKTNEIISTYKAPISSMYIWKRKKDNSYLADRLEFDQPLTEIKLPILKDSIAFYNFEISLHLQDDHWRMMYHIDITRELVEKKKKIYSRFTSH
jgi:hypothetical protein